MAGEARDSDVSVISFFSRRKLPSNTRDECDAFVRARFSAEPHPAAFQGYCSYTVMVGRDTVVQFRPEDHRIPVGLVSEAHGIFGDIVPETKFLGTLGDSDLLVYSMRKLPGASLLDVRASSKPAETRLLRQQAVRNFAHFQAVSWRNSKPREHIPEGGTVGSSIVWRLNLMSAHVPSRFRGLVLKLKRTLGQIEGLPWVMSHGDFLAANIMVCPNTGKIIGLLDWAEAEWLPFGVGMYGLEELLGEEDADGHFQYYPEARELRRLFWNNLRSLVPELLRNPETLRTVKSAQVFGILLWHAIAFDDGRLDRVVQEGVDDGEIQRLDTFLFHPSGSCGWTTLSGRLYLSYNQLQAVVMEKLGYKKPPTRT
jgi:hypothetical protein